MRNHHHSHCIRYRVWGGGGTLTANSRPPNPPLPPPASHLGTTSRLSTGTGVAGPALCGCVCAMEWLSDRSRGMALDLHRPEASTQAVQAGDRQAPF